MKATKGVALPPEERAFRDTSVLEATPFRYKGTEVSEACLIDHYETSSIKRPVKVQGRFCVSRSFTLRIRRKPALKGYDVRMRQKPFLTSFYVWTYCEEADVAQVIREYLERISALFSASH